MQRQQIAQQVQNQKYEGRTGSPFLGSSYSVQGNPRHAATSRGTPSQPSRGNTPTRSRRGQRPLVLSRSGSRSLSATRPGRGYGKTPLLARPAYARFHRHEYGEQGLTEQDLDEHGNRIRGAAGRAVIERHNQMQEEATGAPLEVQEAIARMESYVRRREEQQLKDE